MVTRQNFDLSCLRLLIFAVEVRKRLVALRCVCKRQSAEEELPANSRHKTLANRCFRPAAWPVSDPLWYNANGVLPTSTLKYMYTCQSISNTLCYDGHYKDGTNLMVTPPSLKSSPKACSQIPLGQKGTTWNGANARVGIRGKMIMEGGRRPRAGHCNMKGWNLFQPPPGKSNRAQCHLA